MTVEAFGQGRYQTVRLADLVTEGSFNRPVRDAHVDRIVSNMNVRAFGAIIVWEREPGEYVILDGQHRVQAARRRGVPQDAKCIPAIVHTDLTLTGAAELFVKLNASKLVSAYDKFHALIAAKEPRAEDLNRIVVYHGLKIGSTPNDTTISAVAALYHVYEMGEPEGAVLGHTLATLQRAWFENSEALKSPILRGIGLYFHDHRDADPEKIAQALINGPGAPINLMGWAKGLAGPQRMSLDKAIAEVMVKRVVGRGRPGKTKSA